jgi:formylglycine-generating enzyme required for sulfatase activity
VAALLLAIIFIFKPFGGGADGISAADRESAAADDSVLAAGFRGSGGTGAAGASGGKAAGTNEGMAQGLLADAKAFARKQENSIALQRLGSILDRFPDSKAGAEAREALQRHSLNQPLFPEPGQVVTPLEAVAVAPAVEPEVIPEPMPEAEVAANTIPPPPVAPEPRAEAGSSLPTAAVSPRALPAGFRARAEAGVHESGWPIEITTDRDGSAMILVPGGQYDLGRPNGPAEEGPMHRVALTTFYIDQHEVTGGQYRIYQGGRPSQVTLSDDRSPVVNVTQAEATEYLAWVGKRLPTEAQWEAAARSWDGRLYVWGQGLPSENKPGDGRVIGPVMMTPADVSVFGAFDLGGNAWEWTKDTFTTQYHDQYKGQIAVDPQQGPDKSRARFPEATVKGGSKDWTITWRAGAKPESRLPYLGFRGVLVVEGGPPTGAGPAPASGASPPGQAQPGRPAEPAKAKGEVVPF